MTYLDSILPTKHTASSSQESDEKNENITSEHEFVLSEREAEAASQDMAVCGEEDPGEGLEFLVADELENDETRSGEIDGGEIKSDESDSGEARQTKQSVKLPLI